MQHLVSFMLAGGEVCSLGAITRWSYKRYLDPKYVSHYQKKKDKQLNTSLMRLYPLSHQRQYPPSFWQQLETLNQIYTKRRSLNEKQYQDFQALLDSLGDIANDKTFIKALDEHSDSFTLLERTLTHA